MTSHKSIRLVASGAGSSVQSARPSGQMSHTNAFEARRGRGRGLPARRRVTGAVVDAHSARAAWAGFVAQVTGSREHCADVFGVTFQTACNWFDGFSTPTGDKVMQASRDYPAAYARLLARVS
jgi:hypothetical protein